MTLITNHNKYFLYFKPDHGILLFLPFFHYGSYNFFMNRLLVGIYILFSIIFLSWTKESLSSWMSKIPTDHFDRSKEWILKLPEGETLSFKDLLDHLEKVRVIFIGETHDQMEHHRAQLRLIQNLMDRGHKVVVAMEMFERGQQPILDRWTEGVLSEEEFLKEVKWETTWGMDFQLYRDILNEVKDRRLKLLALNIERDLIRKVAQNGVEALSFSDRERLPSIDLKDQAYRSYLQSIYREHQEGVAKDFEKFYQAQILWDEGMAETLSQFLQTPEGKDKTLLVLTGSGHVMFHFGIPNRFYRRIPVPYRIVMLKEWKKEIHQEISFPEATNPVAHFLWLTPPTSLERRKPKIGIILKEKEEPRGVWIERVLPQSLAEKGGLLPEDQILWVNEKEIKHLEDLHEAVFRKGSGDTLIFIVIREGKKKEIKITLP